MDVQTNAELRGETNPGNFAAEMVSTYKLHLHSHMKDTYWAPMKRRNLSLPTPSIQLRWPALSIPITSKSLNSQEQGSKRRLIAN